jgi:uncharacterized damage-inducible protein DinB
MRKRNSANRQFAAAPIGWIKDIREAYAVNERMNQLLLEHLDARAWRAQLSGGKTRTIAAIFAHMQNIRRKWLRLSAPHIKLPLQLNHATCTQSQVRKTLEDSASLCSRMLEEALSGGRVKKFRRDGWAPAWTPGATMFAYMIVHDAHHRGQVCMLAHQLGYKLPAAVTSKLWSWERLRKKSE